MRWNELSRKTIGLIIAVAFLFAGTVIAGVVLLIRAWGGADIARVVSEAVEKQHVTRGGDGREVVSNSMLLTFRPETTESARQEIAKNAGVTIVGEVAHQPHTYLIAFPGQNVLRNLYNLADELQRHPDIVDARLIPVE